MLYCTRCKSVCDDSVRDCPSCKRSRTLRPVKDDDEVFFMQVSEGEAAEIDGIFEANAIRHAITPVKSGFSTSVYDPEYIPTDKEIFVEQQDFERAKEVMAAEIRPEAEEEPQEPEMPKGKRMVIQTVSIIAFMIVVALVVFASDFVANLLKELFMK